MSIEELERRVAALEEQMRSLSAHLLQKSEADLKSAYAERDQLLQKEDLIRSRHKMLDDILIRIEVLEEKSPPPTQFDGAGPE